MPRTGNGRLIVVVVLAIGLSLGGLGSWWIVHARPVPGAYVDAIALPDGGAIVIRHERGTDHSFIELHGRDGMRWRGLIPHYAGGPGTVAAASSGAVVTVRVARGGHPYLFAFDAATGGKIDSFDLADEVPPDPHAYTLPGLATVADGERAIEVIGRPGGGARLIMLDLHGQRLVWKVDVAAAPDAVWTAGDQVVARTGTALAAWAIPTGTAMPPPTDGPAAAPPALARPSYPVPAGALPAQPYHHAGGRIWIVAPTAITVLDESLAPVRTLR